MKFGRYVFLFLLLGAFLFVFGNNGLIDNLMLSKKLLILKISSASLAQDNRQMKGEISQLRENYKYIERLARNELGMVRKGELVYRFSD